ncbi:MAG: carbohydrate ABC transporter permease [Methanomassiliicoccales archaeon]
MKGGIVRSIGLYVVVAVILLYTLFPIYTLVLLAFTPFAHASSGSYQLGLYPTGFTLSALMAALAIPQLTLAFYKSLEVAFIVGGLALLIGVPAAYGLSRLSPAIANSISTVLFLANMLPSITIAIPISVTFIRLGLFQTPLSLALAQELVVLPLTVFLLLGAFQSVPKDLLNQARVDGSGLFRTIFTMLVPLARAGVASAFFLSWMISWDEFTFAVFLSAAKPTLPILIYIYITRGNILAAAAFSIIVTIPVIILVIALSRFLKAEVLSGGLNG